MIGTQTQTAMRHILWLTYMTTILTPPISSFWIPLRMPILGLFQGGEMNPDDAEIADHPVIKFAPNAYMHNPDMVQRKTAYLIALKLLGKRFSMEGYYSHFYGPMFDVSRMPATRMATPNGQTPTKSPSKSVYKFSARLDRNSTKFRRSNSTNQRRPKIQLGQFPQTPVNKTMANYRATVPDFKHVTSGPKGDKNEELILAEQHMLEKHKSANNSELSSTAIPSEQTIPSQRPRYDDITTSVAKSAGDPATVTAAGIKMAALPARRNLFGFPAERRRPNPPQIRKFH